MGCEDLIFISALHNARNPTLARHLCFRMLLPKLIVPRSAFVGLTSIEGSRGQSPGRGGCIRLD